METAM